MRGDNAEVALRQQFSNAVQEAVHISGRLLDVIMHKNTGKDGKRSGKLDHSQPPWNGAVAHAYLDLHALARDMERIFRTAAHLPARPRGGTDANTRIALDACTRIAERVDDERVADATRSLDTWCNRAKMILGELERPTRLPRSPGAQEPRCPWCKKLTLRSWTQAGVVRCINPDCKDDAGRRPYAKMEWSSFSNDWMLAWQDGSVGLETSHEH
jgi:hypothetical protein